MNLIRTAKHTALKLYYRYNPLGRCKNLKTDKIKGNKLVDLIKTFPINEVGNDYVVGDLHGNFSQLMKRLEEIGFDKAVDRLFSVGDLIDRGPESHLVVEMLKQTAAWFFPVMGNHELMLIQDQFHPDNGQYWFFGILRQEQQAIIDELSCLPIGIEVETVVGKVAIIHADCPLSSWDDFKTALDEPYGRRYILPALSSRDRIYRNFMNEVAGIKTLYVGHSQVSTVKMLGNVCYVDTDLKYDGQRLTILKIN